jgi:hypothetical protein
VLVLKKLLHTLFTIMQIVAALAFFLILFCIVMFDPQWVLNFFIYSFGVLFGVLFGLLCIRGLSIWFIWLFNGKEIT